ncbi:Rpp14/Pop5 family protein [Nanoarchaeota archaeon]
MLGIKKKLKTILPTLKDRNRYLVFEIVSKGKIDDFGTVSGKIRGSALDLYGQEGVGDMSLRLFKDKWQPITQRGIVKVTHKNIDKMRASMALIKDIDGKEVAVQVIGVSGIMKKAVNNYLAA